MNSFIELQNIITLRISEDSEGSFICHGASIRMQEDLEGHGFFAPLNGSDALYFEVY